MNRFLLSVVAVFWVTASAWAAPAVVQSKTYAGASSDTCTFTLDSTPTSGNMMVAFMAADNDRYLKLSGGPDTWTEIQTGSNGGTVTGRAAWRRIGSESTSQSIWVTDSGNTGHYTSTYVSCIILEISGDVGDGTAIDNSNVTTPGSFGTSITGTSLTPNVNGTLPLAFTGIGNGSNVSESFSTASSGWTEIAEAIPSQRASAAYQHTVVSDTTAQNITIDFASTEWAVEITVLIKPAAGGGGGGGGGRNLTTLGVGE